MKKSVKSTKPDMTKELFTALKDLEMKKNIKESIIIDAIKASILQACKNHYNKTEANNVIVNINQETGTYDVYAEKTVSETVEDELEQISLPDARMIDPKYELGDIVRVKIDSSKFGRIATQNAKNVILQKIREEERNSISQEFKELKDEMVTGMVQNVSGKNLIVRIRRADAILAPEEMIPNEKFRINQEVKLYVLDVKENQKWPKVLVSRRHPNLIRRLFEAQVPEIAEGIVEIKSIAREAGNRTKIAVWSNDPDVDPISACVGKKASRVKAITAELHNEQIDIIQWDENPGLFIEKALQPAAVIYVGVDPEDKAAMVVVPDNQLSLAIGKEGLNAKLAAHLTGYKIDIKNETEAIAAGDMEAYEEDEYYEDGEYEDYEEYEGYEDTSSEETAGDASSEGTFEDTSYIEETGETDEQQMDPAAPAGEEA